MQNEKKENSYKNGAIKISNSGITMAIKEKEAKLSPYLSTNT
jgi:hypothetical protein